MKQEEIYDLELLQEDDDTAWQIADYIIDYINVDEDEVDGIATLSSSAELYNKIDTDEDFKGLIETLVERMVKDVTDKVIGVDINAEVDNAILIEWAEQF